MTTFDEEVKHPLNSRMFACPVQGKWIRFQLTDEFGKRLSSVEPPYNEARP